MVSQVISRRWCGCFVLPTFESLYIYTLYGIVVLVGDLTIVLFCFRVFIYSCVVGDSLSWDRSAIPSSSSWKKFVNISFPIRERRGSTVNGVPSAWLRCFALRSEINWSIRIGSFIVLKCKFLIDFISFYCTDVSVGRSIIFNFFLAEVTVRYFIFLHIAMTCYIFWMLSIFFSDEDVFTIFIAETLFIRCIFLNSFAFFCIFFKSRMTQRRYLFSFDGWFQLVSIGVFMGERLVFYTELFWLSRLRHPLLYHEFLETMDRYYCDFLYSFLLWALSVWFVYLIDLDIFLLVLSIFFH